MSDKHDFSYYIKCMIGGALACGLTHTAICPLDIVKCRMQVLEICVYLIHRSTPLSTNPLEMVSLKSELLKVPLV